MEKLSVRGYVEVLRHYREIIGDPPPAGAGACSPSGPTSSSASTPRTSTSASSAQLKDAGIPTVHYVSPSVWAWRGWRVRSDRALGDRILVMFPFEAPLYEKAGVPVTYVGHPLADVIPLEPTKRRGARRSCACRRAS